ncbi:MAG: hypothetical protein CJBNEKGG_02953 [Prosthecobacter sp.]|nr:hypothetical protein [Prosthecobacter sp.]
MDAKIIIYGFCLALVIAGSFFWRYTMQIDEAEKEMLLARQQMNASEDGVKQAKGWLAARKEAAALIAAAAVIEKDNKALKEAVDALQRKKTEIIKVFNSSIQRARQETVGMEFPDLQLNSGARFRDVKIQSIDESLVVLKHSEGVSKVPTSAMPSELMDRLRFGFIPGTTGSPAGASASSSGSNGQKTPSS